MPFHSLTPEAIQYSRAVANQSRNLELAVIDYDCGPALVFPCRRILRGWITSETKERINVPPGMVRT